MSYVCEQSNKQLDKVFVLYVAVFIIRVIGGSCPRKVVHYLR